ncbi:IS481 family transposase [Brevibacterium sp. p3-SID960]|nr:IS481 family transposase [Brevibacterium sp. p3-SID960]
MSVAAAAKKFGVSRQWIYQLIARYQAFGPSGVQPRSTAPHSRPITTCEAVRERIINLRDELTATGSENGAETIAWHLQQEGLQVPSKATIHRVLKDAGRVTPAPHKRPKSSYRRFAAELPNEMWQTDITHTLLSDGSRADILDFLDDHSRYLLGIRAFLPCTGADVVAVMDELISTFGPPAATLSDNGLVFTSRMTGRPGAKNGFETLLAAHHIKQKNGKPGHPQTQGKIERFHQTLKNRLQARYSPPASLDQLQQQLDATRHWYNNERPHRAIGMRTPRQAYEALPKASPATTSQIEYRTRVDAVDKDGKVTVRYAGRLRHLGIGRAHRGRLILMLIHDILMLIHDRDVITSDRTTGEIIAYHHIDPAKNYQPKRDTL